MSTSWQQFDTKNVSTLFILKKNDKLRLLPFKAFFCGKFLLHLFLWNATFLDTKKNFGFLNPHNLPPTGFPGNRLRVVWMQAVRKFHTCCFIWYWITPKHYYSSRAWLGLKGMQINWNRDRWFAYINTIMFGENKFYRRIILLSNTFILSLIS